MLKIPAAAASCPAVVLSAWHYTQQDSAGADEPFRTSLFQFERAQLDFFQVRHPQTSTQTKTESEQNILQNPSRLQRSLVRPSDLDCDGVPLGSGPASFVILLHTELEDLATSPHHRFHQARTSYGYRHRRPCHRRPYPRHVNWRWSSSFETALLQTLCRTFS